MRKLFCLLVFLVAGALPAMATSVTATVADANGNLYRNGRYTIIYQAGATLQSAATPLSLTGVLGYGGELAVTLYDNSTSGSTYLFNICTQNGQPCFSLAITITGTSQSITTELAAAAALLTNTNSGTIVTLTTQTAPVGTPATGSSALYFKSSDKKLYYKTDAGTETGPLSSTTGGTPPFSAITAGTNAVALVMGTGGSLTVSGSGTINATTLNSATFAAPGTIGGGTPAAATFTTLTATTNNSATNCKGVGTAASPSVVTCAAAAAGMFSCATDASTATCQVNTTAVTANSEIFITQNAADGGASQLNVTCNTTNVLHATKPILLSKSAGVSFTINLGTVTTNPGCFEFRIVN